MSQERIDAAAEAVMHAAFGQELPESPDDLANAALTAADGVMFSDEAMERVAKQLCAANNLNFDYWERYPEDSLIKEKYRDQARAMVATLKGDA